jgi:hypothetical protein
MVFFAQIILFNSTEYKIKTHIKKQTGIIRNKRLFIRELNINTSPATTIDITKTITSLFELFTSKKRIK